MGRLKTLHPKVHGGILCRHDNPSALQSLAEHGIVTFELVVVNLYPFEATVSRPDVTLEEAIEKIDIGGPTMVSRGGQESRLYDHRHRGRTVQRDSRSDYCKRLHDARVAVASWPPRRLPTRPATIGPSPTTLPVVTAEGPFPGTLNMTFKRKEVLRYGENPHQQAAVYSKPHTSVANVVSAQQLNGKELSYNNLIDMDSALAIVRDFADPAAVVIKHNNPCGAAVAASPAEALRLAMAGDPPKCVRIRPGPESSRRCGHGRSAHRAGAVHRGHRSARLRAQRTEYSDNQAQVEGKRPPRESGRFRRADAALGRSLYPRRPAAARRRRDARSGRPMASRHREEAYGRPNGRFFASPGRWCDT